MARLTALVVLAGCGEGPTDLGPFAIRLRLDDRPGALCTSASCDDYGLGCGATLSVRIVDVEDDRRLVANACEEIPAAETLCGLGELSRPTFFNIPPHRLRIYVAAWRPEVLRAPELGLDGNCPDSDEEMFTVGGVPSATFQPQPAFAGAAYFDAGSTADVADIPLSCSDSIQLDEPECADVSTAVTIRADDIETALDITPRQAANLNVGVAEPRAVPDGAGGTAFVIEASDTTPLPSVTGPVPSFSGEVPGQLGETACAVVLDLTPQSTSSVVCDAVDPGQDPLDLRGALVTPATLDPILAAIGVSGFPADGLVVGRVLDHTGAPLSRVSLSPSAGSVDYLSSDRSTLIGDETSTSGFFVARDVPFGTAWTAVHNVDGRREDGALRAGLIRGKVTALIVRMEPP